MEILLQQIINGLVLGSMYALVALGYTMVYGIINLINFAHGEVLMVGALTSWSIIVTMQESLPWTAGLDHPDHRAGDLLRGGGGAQFRDREGGLPAAAQQPQAGAPDHRHRHVAPAADAGHDHLQAELQALSHAVAGRADRRRRRGDHAHADHDPGPHGGVAGGADVPGQLHQAGPGHARHLRESARRRADGRAARHGDFRHLHHRRRAGHHRRRDVRLQLRHGAAHHGLPAGPEGLHRGRVRRHRQPGRRGGRAASCWG